MILDFRFWILTLREKKRNRTKHTRRTVPLSDKLRSALSNWLEQHSGGKYVFQLGALPRSRSSNGSKSQLSVHQAHDHLKRALTGKWSKIKGWHVFRHSFASNCAAKGVDQRIINEWMGHQTEEMVKRYRHLFPDVQRDAMRAVFANK